MLLTAGARTVLPKINQQGLSIIPVPVPPLEEQTEIVHRVEALFAIAARIEGGYAVLKGKVDRLPQAILAKAFRGELVGAKVEREMKQYEEMGMGCRWQRRGEG